MANDETLSPNETGEIFSEIHLSKSCLELSETQILSSEDPLLLQILAAISQCFVHHCVIISEYMSKLNNDYEILAEYTSRVKYDRLYIVHSSFTSGMPTLQRCWNLKRHSKHF